MQAYYESPIGRLTLESDGRFLTGLWMEQQMYFDDRIDPECKNWNASGCEIFLQTADWLDRYFKGECPDASELSLKAVGTEFRELIWKFLLEIPYGEVTSYGALARKVEELRPGKRMSAQAIGGAIGDNPIGIIIPCHRVIGSDGSLTGYGGGIERKIWLLEHEKRTVR